MGDTVGADAFVGQRLYLFPAMEEGEDGEAEAALMGMEALLEAAQEAAEVNAAMEQSLQGVAWVLYFHRPEDAGGPAAGRKIQLQLDALVNRWRRAANGGGRALRSSRLPACVFGGGRDIDTT